VELKRDRGVQAALIGFGQSVACDINEKILDSGADRRLVSEHIDHINQFG
jgi:hypothetical protein